MIVSGTHNCLLPRVPLASSSDPYDIYGASAGLILGVATCHVQVPLPPVVAFCYVFEVCVCVSYT